MSDDADDPFFHFKQMVERASFQNQVEMARANFRIGLMYVVLAAAFALLWFFVGFALAFTLFKH